MKHDVIFLGTTEEKHLSDDISIVAYNDFVDSIILEKRDALNLMFPELCVTCNLSGVEHVLRVKYNFKPRLTSDDGITPILTIEITSIDATIANGNKPDSNVIRYSSGDNPLTSIENVKECYGIAVSWLEDVSGVVLNPTDGYGKLCVPKIPKKENFILRSVKMLLAKRVIHASVIATENQLSLQSKLMRKWNYFMHFVTGRF